MERSQVIQHKLMLLGQRLLLQHLLNCPLPQEDGSMTNTAGLQTKNLQLPMQVRQNSLAFFWDMCLLTMQAVSVDACSIQQASLLHSTRIAYTAAQSCLPTQISVPCRVYTA